MAKPRIIITGKLPPPYFGPAIATQIILGSGLNAHYELLHFDTRLNQSQGAIGAWSLRKLLLSLKQYYRLTALLRKERPALILIPISQTSMGFVKDAVFILLSAAFRTRILLHLRGSDFLNWYNRTSALMKAFTRFTLRRAHGVIVLGESLRHIFEPFFEDRDIHVVPNGADYNIPADAQPADSKVNILYLSNFRASKGILDVIDAVQLLNETHAGEYHFTALGNWSEKQVQKAVMSKLSGRELPVTLLTADQSADKFRLLAEADIFVFPPRMPEGHPWVIVEAMAAGLPVISTNQGAIAESVKENVNGFITEAGNAEHIAQKLRMLVSDKALRERMGKASSEIYEAYYTESAMTANLHRVFEHVLKK